MLGLAVRRAGVHSSLVSTTRDGAAGEQVRVPVQGMTCRACEARVGASLRRVPGVLDADVSSRAGRAVLVVDPAVPREQLDADVAEAVAGAGYTVGRSPWLTADPDDWRRAIVAVGVVGTLAVLLLWFGVPDLSAATDVASRGLLVVLLVGLAAGISTCMALVGGLVLAVSSSYAASVSRDDGSPRPTPWRPHAWFHAGRIAGFFVLGALLGAVGSRFSLPERLQAVVTVGIAVVLVVLGIRLLRLSPRISGWSPTLPPSLARALGVQERSSLPYSDARTALLGALTFLLPCGFTQAMQLYALTTGSALTAGVVMAVFAIGTTPGLLAVGGLPGLASGRAREQVLAFAGALLIVFAAVNASGALTLLGLTPSSAREVPTALTSNVSVSGGMQTVVTDQTSRGYVPGTAVVAAGVPIRWEITSVSDLTCAAYMRGITDPAWKVDLTTGANVIELPALAPGPWDFTCAMGMYRGTIYAIERPSS